MTLQELEYQQETKYYNNQLSYDEFNAYIQFLVKISEAYRKANSLHGYNFSDSFDINYNLVIKPFIYDFEDSFDENDWRKMFVTKLLVTHTGNCHSLPFLYKILCEEQGSKAYLAYAPNHIYIKQRNKKDGWYNTELTSGLFPIDAWVMASGYVSTETIKNSLYMDTLSQKQSLAQCLIDLARGYERLKKENYYDFVTMCCNTALKYNPNYVEGLLYKSETLKKQYDNFNQSGVPSQAQAIFPDMQKSYVYLAKLGYREIPEEMYNEWINSLSKNLKN